MNTTPSFTLGLGDPVISSTAPILSTNLIKAVANTSTPALYNHKAQCMGFNHQCFKCCERCFGGLQQCKAYGLIIIR